MDEPLTPVSTSSDWRMGAWVIEGLPRDNPPSYVAARRDMVHEKPIDMTWLYGDGSTQTGTFRAEPTRHEVELMEERIRAADALADVFSGWLALDTRHVTPNLEDALAAYQKFRPQQGDHSFGQVLGGAQA